VLASCERIGIEAVAEVGPGAISSRPPTPCSATVTPSTRPWWSDWRNYGAWSDDGAKNRDRARELALARDSRVPLSRRPWTRPCTKR